MRRKTKLTPSEFWRCLYEALADENLPPGTLVIVVDGLSTFAIWRIERRIAKLQRHGLAPEVEVVEYDWADPTSLVGQNVIASVCTTESYDRIDGYRLMDSVRRRGQSRTGHDIQLVLSPLRAVWGA